MRMPHEDRGPQRHSADNSVFLKTGEAEGIEGKQQWEHTNRMCIFVRQSGCVFFVRGWVDHCAGDIEGDMMLEEGRENRVSVLFLLCIGVGAGRSVQSGWCPGGRCNDGRRQWTHFSSGSASTGFGVGFFTGTGALATGGAATGATGSRVATGGGSSGVGRGGLVQTKHMIKDSHSWPGGGGGERFLESRAEEELKWWIGWWTFVFGVVVVLIGKK